MVCPPLVTSDGYYYAKTSDEFGGLRVTDNRMASVGNAPQQS